MIIEFGAKKFTVFLLQNQIFELLIQKVSIDIQIVDDGEKFWIPVVVF